MENKSLYEIAFTERDAEIRRLEAARVSLESEIEEAMAEFSRITKRKKLRRRCEKHVTPLLLEGSKRRD